MKAAYLDLRRSGAPLVVGELPEPRIGGDQLKIAVHAASVNPVDWKTIQSVRRLLSARGLPLPPWIVGNDASGVVLEVGPRVTKFAPGDAVFLFRRALGLATAGGAGAGLAVLCGFAAFALFEGAAPLVQAAEGYGRMQRSAARLRAIAEQTCDVVTPATPVAPSGRHDVRVEALSFAYPGSETPALEHVSLALPESTESVTTS